MRTLTERYHTYLNTKESGMSVCEFLTYQEYQILYEMDWEDIKGKLQKYRDIEPIPRKAAKYAAAGVVGAAVGAYAGDAIPHGGDSAAPMAAALGSLIFMKILKMYRHWSDKCTYRCKGLKSGDSENALCRAKCNLQGCDEALTKINAPMHALLAKESDPDKKEKIKKKFEKLSKFFVTRRKRYEQQIKDYEGSMRGRSGQGH